MITLHVLDEDLTYRGRIQSYQSLKWKEQYNDQGGFSLVCEDTDHNAALLRQGWLLYRADRKTAMHVVNVVRNSAKGQISATGYTELCLLNRRAMDEAYTVTDAETGMYGVVADNLRGLPVDLLPAVGFGMPWDGTLEEMSVLDAVCSIGKYGGLGVKMLIDPGAKKRIFAVYQGRDKTYSPGAGGRVFSAEFGNLRAVTITEDDELYRNVAIVRGLGQDEKLKEVVIGSVEGLDRREVLVKVPTQSSKQTAKEYRQEMQTAGRQALQQQRRVQTFEVEISPEEFGTAYDLGDLVTCKASRYGLRFDQRITEFNETHEKGVSKVVLTLGEPAVTYAESIASKGSVVRGSTTPSAALAAYPVGSVYVSSTNVSPADTMGGEWELVDKLLANAAYNATSNAVKVNSTNVSSLGTTLINVDGNTVEILVNVTTKVAVSEAAVELFTISLSNIGVETIGAKRITGYSDDGNGLINASVNNSGVVSATDAITKTSGGQIAASSTVAFSATWKIGFANRIDSFCDRFFWKRTA